MRNARKFGWMLAALAAAGAAGCDARAEDTSSALAAVMQRAEARGYRLREVYWDNVLRQRWAVLESVSHPEQPRLAELTEVSADELAAQVGATIAAVATAAKVVEMAVRSGDRVTLWSTEKNIRMQMAGTVQQTAAVGERVQVRITGASVSGFQGPLVYGVVRGPGSVEIE